MTIGSCFRHPTQEVILKHLFNEEFKYELPQNATIITLPSETCVGCNILAKQCYRNLAHKPDVIVVCTDTQGVATPTGSRVFWDKNRRISELQIGQQPHYLEIKNGKIVFLKEFSKENYPMILQKTQTP